MEFFFPEAAQLAVDQMGSATLQGRPVKVGRPNNTAQAAPVVEQILARTKDDPRIYVSSIHPDIQQEDIKGVFEAFGAITKCIMAPNPQVCLGEGGDAG